MTRWARSFPLFIVLQLFATACGAEPADSTPATQNASSETVDGWRHYRGNPRRTGRTALVGPRSPNLKWQFRTQGRIWGDAAIDTRHVIYVASHDGRLYAVGTDGREIWNFEGEGKIWTSPTITVDGNILIGSDADILFSVNPSGQENWRFHTGVTVPHLQVPAARFDVDTAPLLTPDGRIYFACHSELFALNRDGSLHWRFLAGSADDKIFTSPALGTDGLLYFGTQGNYLFAVNQNKKVAWHHATERDNDSTAVVADDGTIYFGSDDGRVRGIAPGGLLRVNIELGAPIRAPLAIDHQGRILVATYGPQPFVAALDPAEGRVLWRFHTEPGEGDFYGIQSGPMVDGENHIYFGGRDRYIYCLSPSGDLVWKHETGGQVDSGAILGPDGTLYIGSDDGRLYAFGK